MSDLDLLVDRAEAAGALRVYKIGNVPASPPGAYLVLGLDSGTPISTRADGRSPDMRHRLTAQAFGTSHDAVLDMLRLADVAFRDKTLTELDDRYCTRELSTPISRDPDAESLLGALHTYRF